MEISRQTCRDRAARVATCELAELLSKHVQTAGWLREPADRGEVSVQHVLHATVILRGIYHLLMDNKLSQ